MATIFDFTELDAIEELEKLKIPPMLRDGKSTTHLLRNLALTMGIEALKDLYDAKHRLKED